MKTPEELAGEYTRKRYGDTDWKVGLGHRSARRGGVSTSIESAFLAGYQAGRLNSEAVQAAAPQWISVKDRLPEFGNLVLVFGVMEGALVPSVCIGMLSDNAENNYYDNTQPMKLWEAWERIGYDHMLLNNPEIITHWMTLPKPPEE